AMRDRGRRDLRQRHAPRAFAEAWSAAAVAVAVVEVHARAEKPPVLNLQDDRNAEPARDTGQREGVAGQVMNVQQVGARLPQKSFEVALDDAVADGVAPKGIACREVVRHQPYTDAVVEQLHSLAMRARPIGGANV